MNLVREQQAALRPAGVKAVVISLDEAWTYLGCRKGEQRQSVWIWTAVVVESSGRWWRDFAVGGTGYGDFPAFVGPVAGSGQIQR